MTTEPASDDSAAEDSRPSGLFSALLNVRWWIVIALAYPLSIIPAYVAVLLLSSRGINLNVAFQTFYAPVIWVLDNVAWARRLSDLIEPVLRGLAGR
jgi:hypothetical protein